MMALLSLTLCVTFPSISLREKRNHNRRAMCHATWLVSCFFSFFFPISKVASCPELISVNREIDLRIALALELRTAAVEVPPPS